MTQLIGGQVHSELFCSLLLHPILPLSGLRLQKCHDSVVSPPALGFTKVNLPESCNARALGWGRGDILPPHTKRWLFRAALPSTPNKSGQPAEEGRSLLEVKIRSVPRGKTGVGTGPQMGRHVLARPQNSLSLRRGPLDSPGHFQTASFKLICSRHARATADPLLKGTVCHWQEQSRSWGRYMEAGGSLR